MALRLEDLGAYKGQAQRVLDDVTKLLEEPVFADFEVASKSSSQVSLSLVTVEGTLLACCNDDVVDVPVGLVLKPDYPISPPYCRLKVPAGMRVVPNHPAVTPTGVIKASAVPAIRDWAQLDDTARSLIDVLLATADAFGETAPFEEREASPATPDTPALPNGGHSHTQPGEPTAPAPQSTTGVTAPQQPAADAAETSLSEPPPAGSGPAEEGESAAERRSEGDTACPSGGGGAGDVDVVPLALSPDPSRSGVDFIPVESDGALLVQHVASGNAAEAGDASADTTTATATATPTPAEETAVEEAESAADAGAAHPLPEAPEESAEGTAREGEGDFAGEAQAGPAVGVREEPQPSVPPPPAPAAPEGGGPAHCEEVSQDELTLPSPSAANPPAPAAREGGEGLGGPPAAAVGPAVSDASPLPADAPSQGIQGETHSGVAAVADVAGTPGGEEEEEESGHLQADPNLPDGADFSEGDAGHLGVGLVGAPEGPPPPAEPEGAGEGVETAEPADTTAPHHPHPEERNGGGGDAERQDTLPLGADPPEGSLPYSEPNLPQHQVEEEAEAVCPPAAHPTDTTTAEVHPVQSADTIPQGGVWPDHADPGLPVTRDEDSADMRLLLAGMDSATLTLADVPPEEEEVTGGATSGVGNPPQGWPADIDPSSVDLVDIDVADLPDSSGGAGADQHPPHIEDPFASSTSPAPPPGGVAGVGSSHPQQTQPQTSSAVSALFSLEGVVPPPAEPGRGGGGEGDGSSPEGEGVAHAPHPPVVVAGGVPALDAAATPRGGVGAGVSPPVSPKRHDGYVALSRRGAGVRFGDIFPGEGAGGDAEVERRAKGQLVQAIAERLARDKAVIIQSENAKAARAAAAREAKALARENMKQLAEVLRERHASLKEAVPAVSSAVKDAEQAEARAAEFVSAPGTVFLDLIQPETPLLQQQLEVSSLDRAIEDCFYALDEALKKDVLDAHQFHRHVLDLGRRQFECRVLQKNILEKQGKGKPPEMRAAPAPQQHANPLGDLFKDAPVQPRQRTGSVGGPAVGSQPGGGVARQTGASAVAAEAPPTRQTDRQQQRRDVERLVDEFPECDSTIVGDVYYNTGNCVATARKRLSEIY